MAKELEQFFKDLPPEDKSKADIFGDKKTTVEVATKEGESEEDTPKKNRHSRRYEAKYQAEREAGIQMAATIKAQKELIDSLKESGKFSKEVGDEINDKGLRDWLRIYGDKPEHREAYEILKNNIIGPVSQRAEKLAEELEELKNRDVVANQQVKEFEGFIDRQFERLEDEYDVDIATDEKLRNALIDEVKRISPKDEEGNITQYGDFNAAMENVLEKSKIVDTGSQKRNDIASKSMANSGGNAGNTAPTKTSGFFGWKKDMKL
jgi:hypothetical protein